MDKNKINENTYVEDSLNGIPGKYIDKLNNEQLQAVIDGKNDADKTKREGGNLENGLVQMLKMLQYIVL